ncbi:MAG: GNAT family N-acetyltransferase [Thaumarchaeota archaeon]|nr:GNAT family N-acetyltransferase [Nitrososphaerota archaeon]
MPGFRIRRASIRDLPALVHHRHAMLAEMAPATPRQLATMDRAYARFVRQEMKGRRMFCFLVETGEGEVAAGGAIWLRETPPRVNFRGGRIPYLMSLYTEPAYRGRGLATLIVKETMKWSRDRGYPWMLLHATAAGRGLYEKLGWEPTPEMRYRFTTAGR